MPGDADVRRTPALVPVPRSASFPGTAGLPVAGAAVSGPPDATEHLVRGLRDRAGVDVAHDAEGAIVLGLGHDGPAESYTLTVDDGSARVTGADAAGLFRGIQTLLQLLVEEDGAWMLAAAVVDDAPRFAYRGLMLDVARHFFPVPVVEGVIDRLAALKGNHLHLHLTDDQGWRVQLRSHPELTARGADTAIGGATGGFYTREDYARIVAYAAARHVTIVPEIDVPGHTHAVGLAYPGLVEAPAITDDVRDAAARFGGGLPRVGEPYTGFAVGFSSLRLGDEATYDFLADVFGELAALTPGPYLHLGGDEAHATDSQEYAAAIARVVDIVQATGKTPIAWHEAAAVPGLTVDLVAQYWGLVDGDPAHVAAAAAGDAVILSPADAVYLDQKPEAGYPIGLEWAAGPTDLARAYRWEPDEIVPGADVLGIEAALWTETVATPADIDAMLFPRLAAAMEIAWSPAAGAVADRTWESFRARVDGLLPVWAALGIVAGPDGLTETAGSAPPERRTDG
jgi:hexosaminidase